MFFIIVSFQKFGALGLNRTDSHGLQNRWFTTNRQGQNWWRWLESSQRSFPYEGTALDHYATSPLVRVLSYLFKGTFQPSLHPSDSPQVSHQRRRIHAKMSTTTIVWLLVRHFVLQTLTNGSGGRDRTYDRRINSALPYRLATPEQMLPLCGGNYRASSTWTSEQHLVPTTHHHALLPPASRPERILALPAPFSPNGKVLWLSHHFSTCGPH